jgi:hypothetical protein
VRRIVRLASVLILCGLPLAGPAAAQCERRTITCGQTVTREFDAGSCDLPPPGEVLPPELGVGSEDRWAFSGRAGQVVTIELTSSAFTTRLTLSDPLACEGDQNGMVWEVIRERGQAPPRLRLELDRTGRWCISTSGHLSPWDYDSVWGTPYTLSLQCRNAPVGGGTPGGGRVPSAPSELVAEAVSTSSVRLRWTDNSKNETAFRVELRREGAGEFEEAAVLSRNVATALIDGLDRGALYEFRVRASNAAGVSEGSPSAAVVTLDDPAPCRPDGSHLCLDEGRFRVRASWRRPDGTGSRARVEELSDNTGYLWFFAQENVESVVKLLDGCELNDHFWLFAAGLTDLQVDLVVTDSLTGKSWASVNPLGETFRTVVDTAAFSCAEARP